MRVAILSNHRSGRGRATRLATRLHMALHDAGHACWQAETSSREDDPRLREVIRDAEVVVVCGGDGSLRTSARAAREAGAMLWHAPAGTENLFARHFGMRRSPVSLLRAIDRGARAELDIWDADGHAFLVMASVGLDADIVEEVARRRRGPQGRRHWMRPILRHAVRWRAPLCEIRDRSGRMLRSAAGTFIAANLPEYAARMNPVSRAVGHDGRLDALLLRCSSTFGLLPWAVRGWLGWTGGACEPLPVDGAEVRTDRACHWQLDGCPMPGAARDRLVLQRDEDPLTVLLPA